MRASVVKSACPWAPPASARICSAGRSRAGPPSVASNWSCTIPRRTCPARRWTGLSWTIMRRIRARESGGIVVYKLDRFACTLVGGLTTLNERGLRRARPWRQRAVPGLQQTRWPGGLITSLIWPSWSSVPAAA